MILSRLSNPQICSRFILFAIKFVYKELDPASFLFERHFIDKRQYQKTLYSGNNFELCNLIKNTQPSQLHLALTDFLKRFFYFKNKHEKATPDKNLGRVGELLNYIIFARQTSKSVNIFKKLTSNIFSPGIDFVRINYNTHTNVFRYYFFEVKATIQHLSQQKAKVKKWYNFENFTEKFLEELEFIKSEITRNQRLDTLSKLRICLDLEQLGSLLANQQQPPGNFYFCSSFFFEEGFSQAASYIIKKDNRLSNGNDYFFPMQDFYRTIRRAYLRLGIILKRSIS